MVSFSPTEQAVTPMASKIRMEMTVLEAAWRWGYWVPGRWIS